MQLRTSGNSLKVRGIRAAGKSDAGYLRQLPTIASMIDIQVLLGDTHKFDAGLTNVMHHKLYWFGMLERVTYRFSVIVHHCLHTTAAQYLSALCTLIADAASWRQLRSVCQN